MDGVAFATTNDIEDRWRPLTATESTVAETLLDDASDMIRARWSDIDARITNRSVSEQTLTRITVGMVRRAIINTDADGLESRSETTGPFGVTAKFTNPNGNLYLSADDIRALNLNGYVPTATMRWLA